MPHKHTRRFKNDLSSFDLPPSSIARSLPTGKDEVSQGTKKQRQERDSLKDDKDTPRAFVRMMQLQTNGKRQRDLDDGNSLAAGKKAKRKNESSSAQNVAQAESTNTQKIPKILPGERMSDFSARVNLAIPISGLSRKVKHIEGMPKERQTRLEKKIQRKIATWRTEEARRKGLKEEQRDLAEQEDTESVAEDDENSSLVEAQGGKKRSRAGKAKDDEDPWAVLKEARDKPKGVFDVAQAPPNITRIPKEKFKIKNGARVDTVNVPRAAGSLRQREELGSARKSIIESYRQMMESRRNTT